MKISVLGAGAAGSLLGGLLQHDSPELEVTLIVRGEHGRVIHERGSVLLRGPWGTWEVPIRSSFEPSAIAGSQFVLVTVKSHNTEEAARAAQPYWSGATVVSIQNGINDHVLSRYVDADKLVMGMTAMNMAVEEPGSVSLLLGGSTIVGPAAGHRGGPQVAAAAELLSRIHQPSLKFMAHPDALGTRYNKLAINALGYASCMSASNFITEALACGSWRTAVGLPIVRECRRVFARAGITLRRIPGIPSLPRLELLMRLMGAPALGPAIVFGAQNLFNRKPIVFSLQLDVQRRKKTEVDYVNGEVVRLAESLGTVAPVNAEVVRAVHELETRGNGTFFSRDEVVRRFQALSAG
jgi:2-dehydropantoate 2-reductase